MLLTIRGLPDVPAGVEHRAGRGECAADEAKLQERALLIGAGLNGELRRAPERGWRERCRLGALASAAEGGQAGVRRRRRAHALGELGAGRAAEAGRGRQAAAHRPLGDDSDSEYYSA